MYEAYLINRHIEFHPKDQLLFNKKNPRWQVHLSIPASRCLLLLIQCQGLVEQSKLFEYAWRENAKSATPNNLYQNISLLRKALKGLTDDDSNWIITVPRKGFRLDEAILIEELHSTDNAILQQSQISETKPTAQKSLLKPGALMKIFRHNNVPALITFCTITLMLITGLAFADRAMFSPPSLADDFYLYKKTEGCQIYVNNDTRVLTSHMEVLTSINQDCMQEPYIYITTYPILHSATVLTCNSPINSKQPSCVSRLVRGFKKS